MSADEPIFTREFSTDSRGRITLGTAFADLDVRVCHSRIASADSEGRIYLGNELANQSVVVALEDVEVGNEIDAGTDEYDQETLIDNE